MRLSVASVAGSGGWAEKLPTKPARWGLGGLLNIELMALLPDIPESLFDLYLQYGFGGLGMLCAVMATWTLARGKED